MCVREREKARARTMARTRRRMPVSELPRLESLQVTLTMCMKPGSILSAAVTPPQPTRTAEVAWGISRARCYRKSKSDASETNMPILHKRPYIYGMPMDGGLSGLRGCTCKRERTPVSDNPDTAAGNSAAVRQREVARPSPPAHWDAHLSLSIFYTQTSL